MGRRRLFDVDDAIDAAMREFWLRGYEGTSLTDLTAAMGIERPSLYSAFGNKEQLFRRVLERYEERHLGFIAAALKAPTAFAVAERLLSGCVDIVTDERVPRGGLDINAAVACSNESETIRIELVEWRNAIERRLRTRFRRARRVGDLPLDARPAALARYLMILCGGIALQAKAGASRRSLDQASRIALAAFPRGR